MQAIILAAGMGKRLKDLTSEATKCMVKVNGVAMIDRDGTFGQAWFIQSGSGSRLRRSETDGLY